MTQGISAMTDNDEKDGYDNNTVAANYGYKLTDKIKLENNIRYLVGILAYDTVADGTVKNLEDDEE